MAKLLQKTVLSLGMSRLHLYFVLFFWGNNITLHAQEASANIFDLTEIIESEKSQTSVQNFNQTEATQNYDVTYYKLHLNVDPDTLFIQGTVTIFFIPFKNITEIVFDLNTHLSTDSIYHQNTAIPFNHTDNVINIQKTFQKNKLDSVTIFYHGSPVKGKTSFVVDQHNGTPILWTLSEPYGAKDWWPCKQSLTDKADSSDVFVTTTSMNKVASNGVLISEKINGNATTTHWQNRYPIAPYLIAIAVTPYAEISFNTSLQNGNLFVQNYVYKEDSAQVRSQLFTTDTLLRYYDSLIGPYPFMNEKYGHAQFGRGGGMEHQTMSFMFHFGFSLNAHEMAHQWFGDKITCGSWHDIWLNEGFATYFAGLPLETMYNGIYWNDWKTTNLERATNIPNGSVYVYDTTDVSRIFDPNLSYAKGAYVLHMLRFQIGDSAFFKGIRSYLSDPNLAYKTALTPDFFGHLENSSGLSLTTFQNQWIYGKGYPSYNLEWDQLNDKVQSKLTQTTSDQSTEFFFLDVPILMISNDGDSLFVKIHHTQNNQENQFKVPFTVRKVIIDPNLELISKANFVFNKSQISDIKIYPVPTNNHLTISPGGEFSRITGYKIISYDGKIIVETSGLNNLSKWSIDVSTLSQGAYQLILYSDKKSITKGFIISK